MPTAAESSDRIISIEPEVFLSHYRSIAEETDAVGDAKAARDARVNSAKASGVNIKALKLVHKLQKMDPRDAQATLRYTILYLRWLGLNLLDQEEMFATTTTGLTDHVSATHAAWEAGRQGYTAGKAGEPVDSNPHAPGSELHQRWAQEWYDGADDRTNPGPKEIRPKDDGEHPEEGGEDV